MKDENWDKIIEIMMDEKYETITEFNQQIILHFERLKFIQSKGSLIERKE